MPFLDLKAATPLLHKFYRDIYEEWLLQNGYRQKETMSFDIYMNTPYEVQSTEHRTDNRYLFPD